MKLLITLAAVAAVAYALPTADEIVLEQVGSFVPQITALQTGSSGPREAAVRAYRMLQQNGNDDAACRALANSMVSEVNSTVSTAQANIDAVDDGSSCGSTYQTEVDAATTANTNAQSALTQAQDALNTAQSQTVTLTQAYIVDPAVTYFTNNPAWVAARTAHSDATSALATAQGAATAAATALTEAQTTQTHQINVCRCTAQSAMAAALATNADNNNAQQNTANWNQAHNLLCVLENTNPCNFAPAPTVQTRTLPADVSAATCGTNEFVDAVELSNHGQTVRSDVGSAVFNERFAACPVVQYTRLGVPMAVYKRTSPIPAGFDAYSVFTGTWVNTNNVLNTDFKLYDNEEDLEADTGAWSFCNYNDPDVAFPRDCGKTGAIGGRWFTMPGGRFTARLDLSFAIHSTTGCPVTATVG